MEGFTIKSNARRAARRAGLDCDTLEFEQNDAGLWVWKDKPAEKADVCECGHKNEACAAPACNAYWPEREKAAAGAPDKAAPQGKTAILLAMLERAEGASIHEIGLATGWLAHTARARISADIGKKLELEVTAKLEAHRGPDGADARVYRVSGAKRQVQEVLI